MKTAVFIFRVFYMLLQYKLGWLLFKHVLLFVIYVFQSYLMLFYSEVLYFSIIKNPAPIHIHTYERRTYVHKIIKGKGCKMYLKKFVDDI